MRYLLIFLFFSVSFLIAETVTISGKILSKTNNFPLSGVNVFIENSSVGTVSLLDGSYEITNIPASEITLVFSSVGYAEKRITQFFEENTIINVKLSQTILDGPIISTLATLANSREAAITHSTLEKEAFDRRYDTQDIPELISDLPSVTFYSENGNGIGYNYLSLRGFDQRRLSIMVNGMPQNDPEDHNVYWLDFPDLAENIQKIQVQRGAGNAFYGPAAIGGSINIKTDHFSPHRKISASIGAGSFNTRKYSASFNSGLLLNKYIIYSRLSNIRSDGYVDRSWTNFWSYFFGAARYENDSNLRLHFYGGPIEDGLAYGGIPKAYNKDKKLRRKNLSYGYERRKDEIENFNQPHFEVLHEWQINNHLSLNNNFFYIKGYGFFDFDGSWGDAEYFRLTPEYGFDPDISIPSDALIRAYVDNDQVGWLPQLAINTDNGDLILGAELRSHRSLHWGRLQKGMDLPSGTTGSAARRYYQYRGGKDIFSFYFHQNYFWYKDIRIQTDMQFVYKQYYLFDEKYLETDFSVPYTFINPRIGLNYAITPNSNVYFSLYNTTREPRLKNLYDAAEASTPLYWGAAIIPQFELKSDGSFNFNKPLVKPETLTGLELGLSFTNNRLSGTINTYYMDFVNEIVKSGGVDRFGQPITGNAKRTLHYGAEFSTKFVPLAYFSIEANLTLSENKIKSYKYYSDPDELTNLGLNYTAEVTASDTNYYADLKENSIAGFPPILGNIRMTYSWQDLYVSIAAKYVGESFTDNFNSQNNKLDAFTVVNLSANYNLKSFNIPMLTLQLRISNLLDTKYLAYGEGDLFFPAATRNYFITLKLNL